MMVWIHLALEVLRDPQESLDFSNCSSQLICSSSGCSSRPSALSNCLDTSFSINHEFEDGEHLKTHCINGCGAKSFDLPIVVRHSGKVSRCVWDGEELKLVCVDGVDGSSLGQLSFNFEDTIRKLNRVCGDAVRNFFLPRVVGPNYLEYVKWKFLHRVFSSALQVLATQAMFRAIGIGYFRSLPSAAALNWVLKDGLGRLSRCIYTACLASAFDTNLKRVRFSTSVLFSLSIGVELLTPVFPQYFLLLATIANIAKQISLACHISTGSAVHRSFAIADNLGEVSAKSQIQTVCFDNIGLMLAATLNILFRNNQRLLETLPFFVYPIFSALDLYGIYRGLKHIHLQTLTKDRLEEIIYIWIHQGHVPSPAEVSEREGVDFLWRKGRELLPIRIGCLNQNQKIPKPTMMMLRSLNDQDFYFVCIERLPHDSGLNDVGILLCVREGAATSEVITGLLQACRIRNSLLPEGLVSADSVVRLWPELIEESKKTAENDAPVLIETMSGLGWACKNVLLTTQEQERFVTCRNSPPAAAGTASTPVASGAIVTRHIFSDLSIPPLYTVNRRSPIPRQYPAFSFSSTARHFTGPVWPINTERQMCRPSSRRQTQMLVSADPLNTKFPDAARHSTASLCPFSTPPWQSSLRRLQKLTRPSDEPL
ncbi:protein root UVB sensitive 4 isoform X2 [Andrographis paniculata]|uniref:protein root UVB sensitive 4 isoform X2 n=1 Tax=Andrographis paniculata TaxID=175694 RepID=UPI0021E8C215|nr:protein root UVB sensitive 4 isoform X2 [Andrographis paniculata]